MKPLVIIAIAVGCSVVAVFLLSELSWYFAGQEVEKAQQELRENLDSLKDKEYDTSQVQILPKTYNEAEEFVERYQKVLENTCEQMHGIDTPEYLECINP